MLIITNQAFLLELIQVSCFSAVKKTFFSNIEYLAGDHTADDHLSCILGLLLGSDHSVNFMLSLIYAVLE